MDDYIKLSDLVGQYPPATIEWLRSHCYLTALDGSPCIERERLE